ncbi:MAG: serpin family protein [Chlamydiales bacterium]|nr:serpin family protein [Chlamydiales bacterium]
MFKYFSVLALILTLLTSCDLANPPPKNNSKKTTKNEEQSIDLSYKDLVIANNTFAFDLYALLKINPNENVLFSPYSASAALVMTALGAKRETWEEMQHTLHWTDGPLELAKAQKALNQHLLQTNSDSLTLSIANALWAQKHYPLLPSFLKLISSDKLGKVFSVDFKDSEVDVASLINQWAKKNTEERIFNLITKEDIEPSTNLVLTNALYLKASWEQTFLKDNTQQAPFFLNTTEITSVEMMQQTSSFPLFQDSNLSIIELPYSASFGYYILLPKQQDGLSKLEENLSSVFVEQLLTKLKIKPVSLSMPRFKISSHIDMNNALKALGMDLPFSTDADFSGIDGNQNLFLSKVLQSTWIAVDEEGTESASATASIMNLKAMRTEPQELIVNHPFIFLIIHKDSGSILFLGRIVNPLLGEN